MSTPSSDARPAGAVRAYPLLAWLVILAVVAFIVVRTLQTASDRQHRLGQIFFDIQVRALVGAAHWRKNGAGSKELKQAQRTLDRGAYSERLRFVVLAGELGGPTQALEQLGQLQKLWEKRGVELSSEDAKRTDLLKRFYENRANPKKAVDLTDEERDRLRRDFGWVGELALAEPGTPERQRLENQAVRTTVVSVVMVLALFGVLGLGFLLLIVVTVLWTQGKLHGGLTRSGGAAPVPTRTMASPTRPPWDPGEAERVTRPGPFPPSLPPSLADGPGVAPALRGGGLYAETFALWMVLYVGLSLGLSWLPGASSRLLLSSAAMLVSLAALAWPHLRGVPWRQVREDLGMFVGPRPGREVLIGIGAYTVAMLCAVATAMVVNGLMMVAKTRSGGDDEFAPVSTPGHPIVEMLAGGGVWAIVQVILAAAVVAPLVEEIVFRGLLYRHLREGLARWGRIQSVLASGLLSGLVFAVIHPQGFYAVPMLAMLALVFAVVREWRGTLLPAMVAHGLNNGALTLALIGMAS
jgi:membrane protease YdiL (CAAX protease family)